MGGMPWSFRTVVGGSMGLQGNTRTASRGRIRVLHRRTPIRWPKPLEESRSRRDGKIAAVNWENNLPVVL